MSAYRYAATLKHDAPLKAGSRPVTTDNGFKNIVMRRHRDLHVTCHFLSAYRYAARPATHIKILVPSPLVARAAADKTFAEQLREAGLSSCDIELENLVAFASTSRVFSLDDLKTLNEKYVRNRVSAMLLTPVQMRKLLRKLGVLTAASALVVHGPVLGQ